MAEYFSLQSALLFSITHIFVRRGLVQSNALTGSLISLGTSTVIFWLLLVVFVPLSSLLNPNIGYFVAGGVFAPAIGQTLGYIGMEKLGVARASSIVNTSPIFSSILAVLLLGERWVLQNIAGTCLVIIGVVILSSGKLEDRRWQKKDLIYPLLGALVFGISTNLRKAGLGVVPEPILAAAVTLVTGFVTLLLIIQCRGGKTALRFHRESSRWLFGAAVLNSGAILSFFAALNIGQIVRVEPVVASNPLLTILWSSIFLRQVETLTGRIILGALFTVAGTILVVTAR
ncbi:MAG TPA: DMT family transporter [Candidatus Binatia bacterium]|nr:DMT family transporter [Candidatus Binatia bacterium]